MELSSHDATGGGQQGLSEKTTTALCLFVLEIVFTIRFEKQKLASKY